MFHVPTAEVLVALHLYIFRGGLNTLSPFTVIVCSCNCEWYGSRPWNWDLRWCFAWILKFPVPVQTVWDRKGEDRGMPMEEFGCEKESCQDEVFKKNLKSLCFFSQMVVLTIYSDYNAQLLTFTFLSIYLRSSRDSQSNLPLHIVLPPDCTFMLILCSYSSHLCFILLDLQFF